MAARRATGPGGPGDTGRDIAIDIDNFGNLSDSILRDSSDGDGEGIGGDDVDFGSARDNEYTVPDDWLDGSGRGRRAAPARAT